MADKVIAGGETVQLGSVTLTAHISPGHTRGCTSWTLQLEQSKIYYEVLFFCSASVAGNRLKAPTQYENIVDDYRRTFSITQNWKPDVFLANHPQFFGLKAKRASQLDGNPLAFVDANRFSNFIQRMASEFDAKLLQQQLKYNLLKSQ